jgi:FHS family L-fucose permease-like MFS transporter
MGRPWQSYYLWWAVVCLVLLAFLAPSRFPPRPQDAEEIRLDQIGKLLCNPILLTYLLGIYLYAAAEIGTYYWIPKFFEDVHGVPAAASNASAVTFMGRVFPSLPAFVCALFFAMQGVGRVLGGAALNKFGTRRVMRFCSVMALASLLVAIFGPKYVSAVGFAACGLFTSVLGPLIFSGTINSLSEFHGTISGLFCANPLAGALVSPLEGWVGDHIGLRTAMLIPALCLTYVVGLAMLGRAKYE